MSTVDRRSFLKGAVMLGTGAALGGLELGLANSAEAFAIPSIASVNDWGAASPRGTITVLNQRPTKILIHHTAGSNSTDYSRSHAYALARAVQQGHFANGWIDSGQHFMVSRGGYALQGRHNSLGALRLGAKQVIGAHCPGQNDISIGIENEGTYSSVSPRPRSTTSSWSCARTSVISTTSRRTASSVTATTTTPHARATSCTRSCPNCVPMSTAFGWLDLRSG